MIKMTNIIKNYAVGSEEVEVLKDISLTINKGEFVAILGPSGSGKSTLMNLIGAMDTWNSGEYYLEGISVHDKKGEKLTRLRNEKIGFIFQKYQLIPTYTVLQNIIMPLLIRGMSKKAAVKEAMEIIKLLNLEERLHHKPTEISGGQQQRVAIARALIGHPSILLADEPTGALDTDTGNEVMNLFLNLHEMGHTIVMITHNTEIAQIADRIIEIKDGKIA